MRFVCLLFFLLVSGGVFGVDDGERQELPSVHKDQEKKDVSMVPDENFEAEIAYFFGVSDKTPVVQAYISALKKIEELGFDGPLSLLEKEVVPYLEIAYKSIALQRGWDFDAHLAAKMELQIILGNERESPFENVKNLMIDLYSLVFQSDSISLYKAAMLRTFLYQYKANIQKQEMKIPLKDQRIMLEIAKESVDLLNSIK